MNPYMAGMSDQRTDQLCDDLANVMSQRDKARAERDRYREAIGQALGLIETASSRTRILQARDVLREAVEPRRKGASDG